MPEDNRLQSRLDEAEATLDAIRSGRVDAVVVEGSEGQQVYTLESADLPYRQFLEQMAEGALSLDSNSTILYCNRFFTDLVERAREKVLGTSFEELIAPQRQVAYRAALRAEHAQRLGSALRLASGLVIPVQLAITPVGSGDSRRYTVVITDLSERERYQELSAAREAVEAESLAKDRFLAALGHELRGPLNVILGWTRYLLEDAPQYPPRAQKALEAIERNARLQQRLIEDMVDVARISSGKLQLAAEPLDLGELAQATVVAMRLSADERRIALTIQAESAVPIVGDAQRLEQMLQNLIGNAIKFTPPGGNVSVRVTQVADVAQVTVADSGRGIDPALLALVFQPFRQGQSDNTGRRESGLGLGLAITKQIVELHGGHVKVDSLGLGQGATFSVELPLAVESARAAAPGSVEEISLAGTRILVVDDHEDIRELIVRTLSRAEAEVVSVSGAESALARLENQPFDAIVSDLMMPGTDGWELARRVRARFGTGVPLIALSASVGALHGDRMQNSGFDAFIAKPAQDAELLGMLHSLLGRLSKP
ncbi:MAG TPA: ATP-binding protein [Polyangiales bacterium]